MSDSEGYLLNAVQTPGPLLPVYRAIDNGCESKTEIETETGMESGLDAALDGLVLLRMIGKESGEYYASPCKWGTGSADLDFKLTALHNLTQECNGSSWGKQAAVLLNYHYLLENDIQYFENNQESLYTAIDEWSREQGYRPTSSQGPIEHNDNKFANWTRLVHFLGLVHKISGREHMVYPDPEIIRTSLELAIDDRGTTVDGVPGIGIAEYLEWLRENLLYVKETADGDVPEGLGQILFELVRDEDIRLVEYGDSGTMGLSGVPPYDGIDNAANTITLH